MTLNNYEIVKVNKKDHLGTPYLEEAHSLSRYAIVDVPLPNKSCFYRLEMICDNILIADAQIEKWHREKEVGERYPIDTYMMIKFKLVVDSHEISIKEEEITTIWMETAYDNVLPFISSWREKEDELQTHKVLIKKFIGANYERVIKVYLNKISFNPELNHLCFNPTSHEIKAPESYSNWEDGFQTHDGQSSSNEDGKTARQS